MAFIASRRFRVAALRSAPSTVNNFAKIMAARNFSSYLVSPKELSEALKKSPPGPISPEPRIIPLCAAWFMPNDGRTGKHAFRECRIPKARFFDLDKYCDRSSPYPHMLSGRKDFAQAMSELGIRKDDTVVVYDTKELGILSAPRVGWTLRYFGHNKVHVLNNFKLYIEQGLPTESGDIFSVECYPYPIPKEEGSSVASFEEVKQIVQNHNKEGSEGVQIIDARSAGRFSGKDPEPRDSLSSGHMPGAINIPFTELLDPTTKAYLPAEELTKVFEKHGLNPEKPIISTCGTGVSACVVDCGLEAAGFGPSESRRVYDGSWTEWAQRVKPSESLIHKDE
ncbi:rhodanese-like domain-containing protein [Zalerion maritima]|uniref:Rhodanese-like domain-containing protein n=1 Tax=Zalerion maritima TaxID=339359 RepID=A0AAD5RJY4_9PEZI|nr:rhodanese-like domain-containing protein [Zalerion maritima]